MDVDRDLLRIRNLSDEALLAGLGDALGSCRQLLARVLAHLGEVEDRRLHLFAGYASMFAYCTAKLAMSEDEACRRIDVARLARRFPILLGQIASGSLSLSVAALLKHRLTDENHAALLAAMSGKTIRQAHEVLASWFPEPDVQPSIRKLPERRCGTITAGLERAPGLPFEPEHGSEIEAATAAAAKDKYDGGIAPVHASDVPDASAAATSANEEPAPAPQGGAGQDAERPPAASDFPDSRDERGAAERGGGAPSPREPVPSGRAPRDGRAIRPLSPGRYRVQFTASMELTRKLELARDLLRHAVPHGDLATLIERAVDLLIEKTMQRRFGETRKPRRERAQAANGTTRDAPPAPGASSSALVHGPRARAKLSHRSATNPEDGAAALAEHSHPCATRADDGTAATAEPCHRSATTEDGASAAAAPCHLSAAKSEKGATAAAAPAPLTKPADGSGAAAEPCHRSATAPEDDASAAAEPCDPPRTQRDDGAAPSPACTSQPPCTSKPCTSQPSCRGSCRYLPADVRRAVLERDGLRCAWRGPDGMRCESRAWLEHDHVIPHGLGGAGSLENIRLFCRSHNRFAAEQAYGKATVARMIARRQRATRVRDHDR